MYCSERDWKVIEIKIGKKIKGKGANDRKNLESPISNKIKDMIYCTTAVIVIIYKMENTQISAEFILKL